MANGSDCIEPKHALLAIVLLGWIAPYVHHSYTYRPIYLLSIHDICKRMEKGYIHANFILTSHEYGFTPNVCTMNHLVSVN
jgi:hypothetical protein